MRTRSKTKRSYGGEVKHACFNASAPLRSACIGCHGSCQEIIRRARASDLAAYPTNCHSKVPRDTPRFPPHILDFFGFASILVWLLCLVCLVVPGNAPFWVGIKRAEEEGRRW
jgi:hypothetical protein